MNDKQINAAQAPVANVDAWKAAVDHELTAFNSTADSFANPREAVRALIDWHISVERDPAVSEMARDAARYRLLRRKVRLAGGEFHIRNLDESLEELRRKQRAVKHWNKLADDVERRADLGLLDTNVAKERADCYRRTARALQHDIDTLVALTKENSND